MKKNLVVLGEVVCVWCVSVCWLLIMCCVIVGDWCVVGLGIWVFVVLCKRVWWVLSVCDFLVYGWLMLYVC